MDFDCTIKKLRKWELVGGIAITISIFLILFLSHQRSLQVEYRQASLENTIESLSEEYNQTFIYIVNDTVQFIDQNGTTRTVGGLYINYLKYSPELNISNQSVIYIDRDWTDYVLGHEACHWLIYHWNCNEFIYGNLSIYHESTCVIFGLWKFPYFDSLVRVLNYGALSSQPDDKYTLYNSSFLKRDCLDKYFKDFEKNCKAGVGFNESLC